MSSFDDIQEIRAGQIAFTRDRATRPNADPAAIALRQPTLEKRLPSPLSGRRAYTLDCRCAAKPATHSQNSFRVYGDAGFLL
jgi:hypothetical protein